MLLSCLSMRMYGMEKPVDVASAPKPKKSVSFESPNDAAKRAEQNDAQHASATVPQSEVSLPGGSSDENVSASDTKKTLSLVDNSTVTDTSEEVNSGTRLTDQQIHSDYDVVTDHNNFMNSSVTHLTPDEFLTLTPDEQTKYLSDIKKTISPNEKARYEAVIKSQKDAAVQLAQQLESNARAAKTDDDVKKIVIDNIDPTGKLTPEITDIAAQPAERVALSSEAQAHFDKYLQSQSDIVAQSAEQAKQLEPQARAAKNDSDVQAIVKEIDFNGDLSDDEVKQAVKAAKVWASNFDASYFSSWVESINRVIAYIKRGPDSLTAKSADALKQILNTRIAKKSKQTSDVVESKNNNLGDVTANQESIPNNSNQPIHNTQQAIDKQSARLADAQERGDGEEVAQIEKNIANLKRVQQRNQARQVEFKDDSSVSGQSIQTENTQQSPDQTSQESAHLCDSIEACISKMNDPKDSASLSSLFKEMDRLSQEPDFAIKYKDPNQQAAVKYFVDNGEKIINNTDNYVFSVKKAFGVSITVPNISSVMEITNNAGNLPKGTNAKPLDQGVLITKSSENAQRVKAEQQADAKKQATNLQDVGQAVSAA